MMSNGNPRRLPSIRVSSLTAAVLCYDNRSPTKRAIRKSVFVRAAFAKLVRLLAGCSEKSVAVIRPVARIGKRVARNFFNDFVDKPCFCEKLHGLSKLGHIPHSQMHPGLATFQLASYTDLRSLGLGSFEPCQPFPDVGLHTVSTLWRHRIFECPLHFSVLLCRANARHYGSEGFDKNAPVKGDGDCLLVQPIESRFLVSFSAGGFIRCPAAFLGGARR